MASGIPMEDWIKYHPAEYAHPNIPLAGNSPAGYLAGTILLLIKTENKALWSKGYIFDTTVYQNQIPPEYQISFPLFKVSEP